MILSEPLSHAVLESGAGVQVEFAEGSRLVWASGAAREVANKAPKRSVVNMLSNMWMLYAFSDVLRVDVCVLAVKAV
jgi:hypothetical protein